jgi:hypothetical protein
MPLPWQKGDQPDSTSGSKHLLGDMEMNIILDGMRSRKAMSFAAILSSSIAWATGADAAHTFFCKATIASDADFGPIGLSGPLVYEMPTQGSCSNSQHSLHFQTQCQDPANSACSTYASGDSSFNSAAFWCGKGVPNGSTIRAYAEVGANGKYTAAQTKGILINKPAVVNTTYDCNIPGTWLDNPSAGNGGHARCVKNSCNAVSGVPAAPSWTSIGPSWSSATGAAWVTDGSGDIWYGVPAHATTIVVSGPECHWQ